MKKPVNPAPAKHLTILHHPFNDIDQMAETLNSTGRRQFQLSQLRLQQFQCGKVPRDKACVKSIREIRRFLRKRLPVVRTSRLRHGQDARTMG